MKVTIGEICLALGKYNICWKMPPWRYRYFWQWHQAAFCQGWSHVRSLCSFGSTLSGVWWTPFWRLLKHTQLEHEMWRFPRIHLWGKSPCDFINSTEFPIKKIMHFSRNIGERSFKCVSALQKWASPSENGFSEVDLHHFNKKKKQARETRMATSEGHCSQNVNISFVL